ncbi:MAG: cytochrome C554 [Ignavibacteriaceae bacterium]|nr:cytochrome C554 [Ignavibacteriaceae bacterium]
MKHKLSFTLALALIILVSNSFAQDKKVNSFIGVEACGTCHKTEKQGKQLDIWKKSTHSQAYKTLQSEKADKIAADLGHKTPAAKTEACLKCHASGYNVDKALLGEKFKVEDGVQCETCHGAGSNYKSLKVMKNRQESVANGLIVHEKTENFCTSCHNSESPTFKEFKFAEMWEKIKHEVPKTN